MKHLIDELDLLGTALGGLRFVQGSLGSVSIKEDATIHVKAGGVRLKAVAGAHTAVPLKLAERALAGDDSATGDVFSMKPRPSIDVYVHALGPRVVAHTTPLGVMLLACASSRWFDLDAMIIPHERPGRNMALAIQKAFEPKPVRGAVLVEREGLIVFANTSRDAIDLTRDLDEKVRRAFGPLRDLDAVRDIYVREASDVPIPGGRSRRLPRRVPSGRYLHSAAVLYSTAIEVKDLSPETQAGALEEAKRPVVLFTADGTRVVVAHTAEQLSFALEITCAHDWLEDALRPRHLAHYLSEGEPARILARPASREI